MTSKNLRDKYIKPVLLSIPGVRRIQKKCNESEIWSNVVLVGGVASVVFMCVR